MKSHGSVDMAQLTALATPFSLGVNSAALRLGLAAALVFFGLYLYLVPNQITVSCILDVRYLRPSRVAEHFEI